MAREWEIQESKSKEYSISPSTKELSDISISFKRTDSKTISHNFSNISHTESNHNVSFIPIDIQSNESAPAISETRETCHVSIFDKKSELIPCKLETAPKKDDNYESVFQARIESKKIIVDTGKFERREESKFVLQPKTEVSNLLTHSPNNSIKTKKVTFGVFIIPIKIRLLGKENWKLSNISIMMEEIRHIFQDQKGYLCLKVCIYLMIYW